MLSHFVQTITVLSNWECLSLMFGSNSVSLCRGLNETLTTSLPLKPFCYRAISWSRIYGPPVVSFELKTVKAPGKKKRPSHVSNAIKSSLSSNSWERAEPSKATSCTDMWGVCGNEAFSQQTFTTNTWISAWSIMWAQMITQRQKLLLIWGNNHRKHRDRQFKMGHKCGYSIMLQPRSLECGCSVKSVEATYATVFQSTEWKHTSQWSFKSVMKCNPFSSVTYLHFISNKLPILFSYNYLHPSNGNIYILVS